ncbi:MAG: ADP,ATP carrier protein 1 [Chlamydiae bacterium]|nr:ADP,ATP carrier protein 1 [Chlamydiota bacterium]
MSHSLTEEFGSIRSFIWPIHRHEQRKLVPMLLMLFLICFNYSILRNMKDAVVVTASGAAVIPFIKFWALLPTAVLLTYVFARLTNRFSQERVVYIIISGFLIFYALFAFVLYPLKDYIHPHALAESLEEASPDGFYGFIEMCRYWSFTVFYVLAELWSSIVMTVLFWGIANEITKIGEARRFYAMFSIALNLAGIIAGQAANYFSTGGTFNPNLPFGKTGWEQTMMILISGVIFSGILVMVIFRWMNQNVLNDPKFEELHSSGRGMKKKQKLSIRESFSYLSGSKYLICIAIVVVAYNLVINLVEVVWKDQLSMQYPSPSDYNAYMNNLTTAIGIVSTCTALFMARMISRYGWTATAMITPVILFITSIGFFIFMFFQDSLSGFVFTLFGTTPLALVVFFGGAQNCLSKAAKYSVFDATKEIAFIPLEHDAKLKGKAAIDGVGSRFGKSGGALIHQGFYVLFGSLTLSSPFIAAILVGVIFFWMYAVRSLGLQFKELVTLQKKQNSKEVSKEHEEEAVSLPSEEQPATA